LHRAAAALSVDDDDRAAADAGLDAVGGEVQPGRLGRARGARGGLARHVVEHRRLASAPAARSVGAHRRLGDADLPRLPEITLGQPTWWLTLLPDGPPYRLGAR